MSDDVEWVECACYTQARRHPEVLGSIGRSVLPVQITAAALMAGVGSFLVLVFTWGWWSWLVPSPLDAIVAVVGPLTLGTVAQVTKIEGRNPALAALALVRYGCRSRSGVVAGRAVPGRRRRRRVEVRTVIGEGVLR